MLGFSFSELIVVVLVALVVMGPKDLPKLLRRLGQWAGKIRRAAADLRAQSGIDDALRSEGLADDIAEIRKLARGELDAVQRLARVDANDASSSPARLPPREDYDRGDDFYVVRDREYPREGCDAYGSIPDNALVYSETMPSSAYARDALYVLGDANAVLPPEPLPEPEPLPVPADPPSARIKLDRSEPGSVEPIGAAPPIETIETVATIETKEAAPTSEEHPQGAR